jgi:hypothetical protein
MKFLWHSKGEVADYSGRTRSLRHELSSLPRSNAGIVGSNPIQGMHVCILCVILCMCCSVYK